MTTEEIRIMFCDELNKMIAITPEEVTFECLLMYGLAMVYINGDYPEYVKKLWGVGKRVNTK